MATSASRTFTLLVSALLVACLSLFLAPAAPAQISNVTDTTSTPIPGVGHDYIQGLSETVNPANGSVSLRIQAPVPPSRGFSIPFFFDYDSNSVHHIEPLEAPYLGQVQWKSNLGAFAQGGWSYSLPALSYNDSELDIALATGVNDGNPVYTIYSCHQVSGYVFREPSGGLHSLYVGAQWADTIQGTQACTGPPMGAGGDGQFYTVLTPRSDSYTQPAFLALPPAVYGNDGTAYYFGTITNSFTLRDGNNSGWGVMPTSIEDRNGNKATLAVDASGNFTLTDTLGRTAISGSGFGPAGTTNALSFAGVNYQVTWTTVTSTFPVSSHQVVPTPQGTSCTAPPNVSGETQTVVSQITLPNNQHYTFHYGMDNADTRFQNPYGLLNEIDYPTGGWVKYQWQSSSLNELALYPAGYCMATMNDGTGRCAQWGAAQAGCLYQYQTPVVSMRQVSFGGATPSLTQTFTYTTTWNMGGSAPGTTWTQKTTTVTTTDNVTGKSSTTSYTYSPIALPPQPFTNSSVLTNQVPVESSISYYDNSTSTQLRTVNKTWYDQLSLAGEQTTLQDGPDPGASQIVYCYAGANCAPNWPFPQLKEKDEYDFGASSPSRKTITTYQPFSGTPGIIADAPCQTVVTDATGNTVAETDFYYDGGSSLCGTTPAPSVAGVSGLVAGTHDESAFGSGGTAPRGNLTRKTARCLQPGSCVDATTTYTYDETGQVTFMVDPNGNAPGANPAQHTTHYYYDDQYSVGAPPGNTNAYLTTITNPLGQSSKFTYDYNSGQLTSSRDQNDINASRAGTTYQYNDPFLRPTQINAPDGGQTTISYNDSPYSSANNTPSVTTTKKTNSAQNLVSTSAKDGMGHVVRTLLTSDPQGTVITDITYDGFGRVFTQSNPHRSASSPTDGVTTSLYDALGRTIQVIPPDGTTSANNVTTAHYGNATLVTDETGRQRRSVTDGLGRLVEVDEPWPQFTYTPTPGSGPATVATNTNGEQHVPGTPGTRTLTVSGYEQSAALDPCHSAGAGSCPYTVYDSGTMSVTVNGFTASVTYGQTDTAATMASGLANLLNASSSPVVATATGSTVTMCSKVTGSSTNYSFISSHYSNDNTDFGTGSFWVTPSSGALSGGSNSGTTYDTGTVSVTVAGSPASVSYGQSDTAASVALNLKNAVNNSSLPVTAALSGTTLTLTAKTAGANTNYSLACYSSSIYSASGGGLFSSPSFSASCQGALAGGSSNGSINPATELVTQYAYDALGNLDCAVQKGGDTSTFNPMPGTATPCGSASATWRPRSFAYDSLSRLTSSTNPESNTNPATNATVPTTYVYDPNGNVITKTDARGIASYYVYDPLNRVTQRSYNDGTTPTVKYGYDAIPPSGCTLPSLTINNGIGKRTGMCDPAGAEAWSYDLTVGTGWWTTDKRAINGIPNPKTATYYLDLAGNNYQAVYPTGRTVNYVFDSAGRPSKATDSSNGITYAFGACANGVGSDGVCYMPNGAYSALSIGKTASFTGLNITHSYNNRLQPLEFKALSSGGSAIDITYNFVDPVTHGNAGHVYGITNNINNNRSQTFSYDPLNRLVSAGTVLKSSANCWGYQFTYDVWANLLAPGNADPNYSGCSEPQVAPVSANASNRVATFGYDAAGNTLNDTVNSYTYDAESEMTSAAGANYLYDGDGRRVAKLNGSGQPTKVYWYGSGGSILAETNSSGAVTAEYAFFGGQRIAMLPAGGSAQYYVEDMLGSSRVVTTNTGVVCYDADFYPFGGERTVTDNCPSSNKYKFEGKERDDESGNDDFGARYYSWRFGRWLSADWSAVPAPVPYANFTNPQTLNLYAMVADDPETFADLDGHISQEAVCPAFESCASPAIQNRIDNEKTAAAQTAQQQPRPAKKKHHRKAKVKPKPNTTAKPPTPQPSEPSLAALLAYYQQTHDPEAARLFGAKLIMSILGIKVVAVGGGNSVDPTAVPVPTDLMSVLKLIIATGSAPEGWEWRGKGEPGSSRGKWVNEGSGESLYPDLQHGPPQGPHYDYTDPQEQEWRVDPDSGTMTPK